MAVRSGIGGQVGFVNESTYGTYVAPTKFIPMTSASVKDTSTYTYPSGIAGGRLQPLGSHSQRATYGVEGKLEGPVFTTKMGLLLQALMGTSVTPVIIGAGPGYTQTHSLADPYGKSLTIQSGIPTLSDGTANDYTALGCKITAAEFKCAVGETLMASWDFIGRELTEAQTLATATYATTGTTFAWPQSELKIGSTVGGATHVEGVRGVTINVNRAHGRTDAYAGNLGKISEPTIEENDENVISGTLDIDFVTKADFVDRFHAGTQFSLVWEFVGAAFTGGAETFRITLPQCRFTGETPDLSGPGVVQGSMPFVTTFDGTTQPFITYLAQESSL